LSYRQLPGSEVGWQSLSLGFELGQQFRVVSFDKLIEKNAQIHLTPQCAFPLERAESIPRAYLQQYCLKGVGSQRGVISQNPTERSNRFQPIYYRNPSSRYNSNSATRILSSGFRLMPELTIPSI
jgi:hypothetical protein